MPKNEKWMQELYQAEVIQHMRKEREEALGAQLQEARQKIEAEKLAEYRRKFFGGKDKDGNSIESDWHRRVREFVGSQQKSYDTANSIYLETFGFTLLLAEMIEKYHPINIILDLVGDKLGIPGLSVNSLKGQVVDTFKKKLQMTISDVRDKIDKPEVALPVITHFVALDKQNKFTTAVFKPVFSVAQKVAASDEFQTKAQEALKQSVILWMKSLQYNFNPDREQFFDNSKPPKVVTQAEFERLRNHKTHGLDAYLEKSWDKMKAKHDSSLDPSTAPVPRHGGPSAPRPGGP